MATALQEVQTPTLQDVLDRLVDFGYSDPREIAERAERELGEEALKEELFAYREDILAEMARARLGAIRRQAEVRLAPGDPMAKAVMLTKKMWVPPTHDQPGFWGTVGELTAEDLRERAKNYVARAKGNLERAVWLHRTASLMESQGAKTLAKLKADLPPLPTGMSLDELLDDLPE